MIATASASALTSICFSASSSTWWKPPTLWPPVTFETCLWKMNSKAPPKSAEQRVEGERAHVGASARRQGVIAPLDQEQDRVERSARRIAMTPRR